MPAPPEESEPAMVSAIGVVIASLALLVETVPSAVLTRQPIASKLACNAGADLAYWPGPPGDLGDGALFRPDQMQARPVLYGGQCAGRSRDRIRNLFHRRRLRSAGEVLRRQ